MRPGVADAEDLAEAVSEDSDSDSEGEEAGQLREEVVAVYEQIRNLVTNLRRSRPPPHPGTSLHTSIASSGSSTDNLATQFKVGTLLYLALSTVYLTFYDLHL